MNRRKFVSSLALQGAVAAASRTVGAQSVSPSAKNRQEKPLSTKERDSLITYFAGNARKLLREPMGVLHFGSVSPSLPRSTYSTSLWDWDTLWTVRGLFRVANLTHDKQLHADVASHARGCISNFFDHQSEDGRIPMLITVEEADPLGCLEGHRPHKENQAKPVLGQLALVIAHEIDDASWFKPFFSKLKLFYDSWTADNMSKAGLLVWGDDVAIGNDNDPTTFGRPYFSSANVFLNCFYYQDLKAAAELAKRLDLSAEYAVFSERAEKLAQAIQQHCWDPRDSFFYTADVQCIDRRAELIPNIKPGMAMSWDAIPLRIQTFTGFLPLWCKIATPEQASSLVKHLQDPRTFHGAFGVRSLSAAEFMYSLAFSSNPSNWLGPVWIIVNYLVWSGLKANGFTAEANSLANRTATMLASDLEASGSLNEYYHPDTGKPLSHKEFMDWNLLVLEMV